MAENKFQDYFDDDNDGHVDTRESNFESHTILTRASVVTWV